VAIKIIIPAPFQALTSHNHEVEVGAKSIKEMVENLNRKFPGLKSRLCDEKGILRQSINIYVNEQDIRFLSQEATVLKNGDEVAIIPAIAGG
jgi:sulfur-carrier protein